MWNKLVMTGNIISKTNNIIEVTIDSTIINVMIPSNSLVPDVGKNIFINGELKWINDKFILKATSIYDIIKE